MKINETVSETAITEISSVIDDIKQKLKDTEAKYNEIINRLEKEVQEDRKHAQKTYDTIKKIVDNFLNDSKISPGVLQSLNSAISNLQNSTQREKEILQEVAKKQQQLELLYEMSKPPEEEKDDFDKNNIIE